MIHDSDAPRWIGSRSDHQKYFRSFRLFTVPINTLYAILIIVNIHGFAVLLVVVVAVITVLVMFFRI